MADFTLSRWPLHDRHWKYTPKRNLEDRLTDIVVGIVSSTELMTIENDRREVERLRPLERQRLEAERIRRQNEENRRREELEKQASQWHIASGLRSFLKACEAELSGLDLHAPDTPESAWLRWAYEHADRLDPIRNGLVVQAANPPNPT